MALLQAGLVDEEFLILSPLMVGEALGTPRPSLVEGSAFAPGRAPRSTLVSLRRAGNHLFLRSRWTDHHRSFKSD
jgi:riboflavin biosynthesis pyrimidine reductase